MVQVADNTLEARLYRLEQQVRSMTAGNLTDKASVVDASGNTVPLSTIAFGQVLIEDMRDAGVNFPVAANTSYNSGFVDKGGPYLDVYVSTGALRVDFTAMMSIVGTDPETTMSYSLLGPAATQDAVATAPQIAAPDTWRAIDMAIYGSGVDAGTIGTAFGIHTGLAVGWYRVSPRYAFSCAAAPSSNGTFYGIRFAATPY